MSQSSSEIFERFSTQGTAPETEPIDPEVLEAEFAKQAETQQKTQETRKQGGALKRIFKEIFGQFFTVAFWKDAARIVVQELVSTFLISFGNSLAFIGRQKRNDKVGNSAMSAPPGDMSNRAFGGNRGLSNIPSTPKVDVMSRFGYS